MHSRSGEPNTAPRRELVWVSVSLAELCVCAASGKRLSVHFAEFPNLPGVVRTSRHQNEDDLSPCPSSRAYRCLQSVGGM